MSSLRRCRGCGIPRGDRSNYFYSIYYLKSKLRLTLWKIIPLEARQPACNSFYCFKWKRYVQCPLHNISNLLGISSQNLQCTSSRALSLSPYLILSRTLNAGLRNRFFPSRIASKIFFYCFYYFVIACYSHHLLVTYFMTLILVWMLGNFKWHFHEEI
jgi:hypothetical protein